MTCHLEMTTQTSESDFFSIACSKEVLDTKGFVAIRSFASVQLNGCKLPM